MPRPLLVAIALLAGCGLLGGPKAPAAPDGWISELIEPLAGAGFAMEMEVADDESVHAAYLHRTGSELGAGEVYRVRYAVKPAGGSWTVSDVGEELALDKPEKSLVVGPNGEPHVLLRSAAGELVHATLEAEGWVKQVVSSEGGRYPDMIWGADGRFRAIWLTEDLGTVMDGSWRPGGLWDSFELVRGKAARGGMKAGAGLFQAADGTIHAAFVLATDQRARGLWHAWQLPGARWAMENIDARGRVEFGGSLLVDDDGKTHIFASEGGAIVRHVTTNDRGHWWWGLIERQVEDPGGGRATIHKGKIMLTAAVGQTLYVSTLIGPEQWETRGWPAGAAVGSRPPAIAVNDDGYVMLAFCAAPEGKSPLECAPALIEQVDY